MSKYPFGSTVYFLIPLNRKADRWMEENLDLSEWNRRSPMCIEHRYISDIVKGMSEAGFIKDKDFLVTEE